MAALNKTMIIGNLTRDPALKYTPKGTAVTEVSIAVNRTWKDDAGTKREDVTFINVTFWGKNAETLAQYSRKGDPLYIEGRLELDTCEDRDTGKNRSALKVVGEMFQFLGKRQGDQGTPS